MFDAKLHDGGILEIVIARPPVNAFSIGLLEELAARFERIAGEPDVRCALLRSDGRGFCGGGDVKEVEALAGFEGILGHAKGSLRLSLAMMRCPVPVVAAVHGFCVGIGVITAASADVIVAARETRFVLAEIDNGATAGAVQALRLMPEKRVRAAMMTADPIMAQEIHGYGGIYELVDTNERVAECGMAVAARIASKQPAAMRRLKESLNNSSRVDEIAALYRAEISYTYELNIMGVAQDGRQDFLTGKRAGYAD
jgi:enoyl-CoA hydratase